MSPKYKTLRYASPLNNCRNEKAKVLAEKDKEIKHLHELLDIYDKEREEQEKSYE